MVNVPIGPTHFTYLFIGRRFGDTCEYSGGRVCVEMNEFGSTVLKAIFLDDGLRILVRDI